MAKFIEIKKSWNDLIRRQFHKNMVESGKNKMKEWFTPKQNELSKDELKKKALNLYIQSNSQSKLRFLKSPFAIVPIAVPFMYSVVYQNYMEKILGAGFLEPKGKSKSLFQ